MVHVDQDALDQRPVEGGAYDCRRPNCAPRYRCRACGKDFSLTSGTLFASHKLPLRMYLAAITIFCNEVKGKSALAMSRDLGVAYKSAFVLFHKLREGNGRRTERSHDWRRRQGRGSGWWLFRRLCEACEPDVALFILANGKLGASKVKHDPDREICPHCGVHPIAKERD